jgi:hypothetical protein
MREVVSASDRYSRAHRLDVAPATGMSPPRVAAE